MGAELRIENEDARRLADELAVLTGKSVTDAVLAALSATVIKERTAQERSRQMLAGAAELRKHFKEPLGSSDHSFLYDENGLPA